ncbi:hypothetical protein YPPY54_3575, partial [Yersinia pestis PY-54]|jgi:hypothetical protein
MYR